MLNIETWKFPYETASAWYLGNSEAAWVIAKDTGQVLGGWNAKTREFEYAPVSTVRMIE